MEHLTIKELSDRVLALAKEKGFGTTPEEINVPEKMALIHSEVAEAYEAYRKQNFEGKDGFPQELGDIIVRVIHLAAALNIDIEDAIIKKMDINKDRTWNWDQMSESHS